MKLFGEFTKVEENDDGTITVHGVASSGAKDEAGETILASAMKAALPDYMKFANIREMHSTSAAGTALGAEVDDDGFTRISTHIVDPVAITKVKAKVYKGFSVGGKVLARDPSDRSVITKIRLSEISLVDRPCNPDAMIDLWKADLGETEGQEMAYAPTNDEVKAAAEAMAKAAGKTGRANDFLAKAREKLIAEHVGEVEPEAEAESTVERAADLEAEPETEAGPQVAEVDAEGDAEPEAEKADLAGALTAAVEKATAAVAVTEETAAPEQITPGLVDFGKGMAKLGEIYAEDPLAKGLYTVSSLARLIDQLADIQASTTWEAEVEGDGSPVPAALAVSIRSLGENLLAMAREEVAELIAGMGASGSEMVIELVADDDGFAYAAAVVDLVKADADLMEKAGARNSRSDMKVIQGMHDDAVKLGASCEPAAKAAGEGDDLTKLLAEKATLEDAVQKALPAIDLLTKGLEDARAEIDILKAQPMPTRAAGSVHAVTKGEDTSPGTAPTRLTEDQLAAELAKMSDHDRAMLLTKAALRLPMSA